MRRTITWCAALLVLLAATAASPCAAQRLVVKPAGSGFWAGTRLALAAERGSAGRLRVQVHGRISVARPARVSLVAIGCGAVTDSIVSYAWSPENHPPNRQAIPGLPAYQQSGVRRELAVSKTRNVSFSTTVGYAFEDGPPSWTDCVTVQLFQLSPNSSLEWRAAFAVPSNTLFVTVGLRGDARHIPCGPEPSFCAPVRTDQTAALPPALPDFPPAPGYPGAPGFGERGKDYPYHVCPIADGRYVLCSAEQAAAATTAS